MYIPALGAVLAVNAVSTPYNTSIYLPTHKPLNARWLSPNLASFSFEADRWPAWAGYHVGEPNEYTNQIMKNLGERTGEMPFLRIGANSADRSRLNLSVETIENNFPEPTPNSPQPESSANQIGRDYYALSANFPAGTKFHWGINFEAYNKTETVGQAALLADTFQGSRASLTSHVHLRHVEIGNQPDVWGPFTLNGNNIPGSLGPLWTPANYSQSLNEFGLAISEVLKLGGEGEPTLSPGGTTVYTRPRWRPAEVFHAGLLDDPAFDALTDQYDEHLYSGFFSANAVFEPGELMSSVNIRSNLSLQLDGVLAAEAYGKRYIFSETSSIAAHGAPGLSNTLESAIWGVDYMLLAATFGIERCHMHNGVGYAYNVFQPIENSGDATNITRPHINPLYNAFLVVGEAVGKTGDSWLVSLGTSTYNVTAYGVYENKQLTRLVIANKQVYLGEGGRDVYKVLIDNWTEGRTAKYKTLTGPTTTSLQGVTWGGQSFESASGAAEGDEVWDTVEDSTVFVEASSVVLIQFE